MLVFYGHIKNLKILDNQEHNEKRTEYDFWIGMLEKQRPIQGVTNR